MTDDEFRAMALSLAGAVEASHLNHPDFRVRASTAPGSASTTSMG